MKPNTNNYKNKSKRQIDRTFGATQLLTMPHASGTHASGTSEVNYSSNQNNVAPVQPSNTNSQPAANPEPEPASFSTISPSISRAIPVSEPLAQTATLLNPAALLCQVASYQYVVSEQGSQSSTATRFFKPIYDAGYAYALWLAKSKPAVLRSTELSGILAQNTMTSVQRRLTIEPSSNFSLSSLEIVTDVPGLITHCFYQEYANYLQSRRHMCQRQTQTGGKDNWSRTRYCNHATCQPAAAPTLGLAAAADAVGVGSAAITATSTMSTSAIATTETRDNLAFSLDMPRAVRLLLPNTPRKARSILAVNSERLVGLRLAIQTAFTRLSPFQCQAITDFALGYSLPAIGNRRSWTAKRAGKHIYQAKHWLHSELMFSGLLPLPLPAVANATLGNSPQSLLAS